MNTRIADLRLSRLLVALVIAACVAFGTLRLIHSIHVRQQADRAMKCLLSHNTGSPAEQLCEQGKIPYDPNG